VETPTPATEKADELADGHVSVEAKGEALQIPRLRQALDDLFTPNPIRYWLDLFGSLLCFYGGLGAAVAALPLPARLAAFTLSSLGFYRAIIFIHELVHFPPGRMPSFRLAWNFCCGLPALAPDFLYESHADHHRRTTYGTADDGEYLPWGTPGNRVAILAFVGSSLLAPIAGIGRFGILTPLSWLSRRLRYWLTVHASSLVVDANYRRTPPAPGEDRRWRAHEAAVFAYLVVAAAALLTGLISVTWVVLQCLALSTALFLNNLRTLVVHRYRSNGKRSTATEQLLDSVNYPRQAWLNELWAPVGLRFHAVHHLFPGIPYHNLAAAHARLLLLLPPDSPYRQTEGRSLLRGLQELWRAAGAERPEETAMVADRQARLAK
jgi:fatty acid desaturase